MAASSESSLEGVVHRIVFHNQENGWTVLRLNVETKLLQATVVGSFQSINAGERAKFTGSWVVDPKHGRQFKATTCLPLTPETLIGIEKFLGSGLIPGIGDVMAKRLTKRFGLKTLDVIEKSPVRLAEVEGIGPKRAKSISKAMVDKRRIRDVMVFLESCGVSPAFAHRIYQRYGKDAIRRVSDNPYDMAGDVRGIGFLSADKIAAHLGHEKDSPHRAEAGLLFTLEEFASAGHIFAYREDLVARAMELLEVDETMLHKAGERLNLMGKVRVEPLLGGEETVYLPRLHRAEKEAAQNIKRLLSEKVAPLPIDPDEAVARAEKMGKIELAKGQREAFLALNQAKIMVLTGGPGTGKTTLLKGLVSSLLDLRLSVALCAPTGRAARRMGESAGMDARTIHRMLEFQPKNMRFERCKENQLDEDVIVVDEMSMVDVELFSALTSACKTSARLLLVGDPDQLPSVGPGAVLHDLLTLDGFESGRLKIVHLKEIFRQASESLIVTGAHDVLGGRLPKIGEKGEDADLFLVERDSPEDLLDVIKELVAERIPKRFGLNAIEDIQVLTPMHKGLVGATNLNIEIQDLLNKKPGGVISRQHRFKIDDKVMQIRNNYDFEVFNGDIGKITSLNEDEGWLEIEFVSRKIRYPASELDQITLAYACSVHKSQGSEYPAVVIPLHTQHYVMLQRNLLYTAITRGKRLVVIVGSKKAVQIAVRNDSQTMRNSSFAKRIMS